MGGGPFYLAATGAFMRVSLQRFPSLPLEIRNHSSRGAVLEGFLAAIPKSGPEIKNHCTQKVVFGEILTSIRKSGLEIKNRCTHESVNGKNLASIRKSGPEIKNRCTNQPIFSTHPQHIPPARVHHALTTRLALDVLHGDSDAGSTVAAKAGADAPGGGISLCFCRRGCAAPAQKAATLNTRHHKISRNLVITRSRYETAATLNDPATPGTTQHCNKKVRPKRISRTINPNYYDAKL